MEFIRGYSFRVLTFLKAKTQILKTIFDPRYAFRIRYAYFLVGIGVPANFFFYFYETSQGFVDRFWWRAVFTLPLLLMPVFCMVFRNPLARVIYWELALFVFFPVMNTHYLLVNEANKYWFSTFILDLLFLGLFTKYYMIPFHFALGCGGVIFFHSSWGLHSNQTYSDSFQAITASILAAVVANGMTILMEFAFKKIKEAESEHMKAEAAEQRGELLKDANKEQEKIIDIFKTYTRASLTDVILKGEDPRKIVPQEKDYTILFTDIRNFTEITQSLTPYERLYWLNQYFTIGNQNIAMAGGEMDKYMGDCFMALFPSAKAAVEASIAFRRDIQTFNHKMVSAGVPKFLIRTGTGIAKGRVTHGNIGSMAKMDLTVIGPAVNIASRIENLTKIYNIELLVTEDVVAELGDYPHCRWVDKVQVKGVSESLRIYEIYGHQAPDVIAYKDSCRELLEKALAIYFRGSFNDAERLFRALQERVPPHTFMPNEPMDRICLYFISRCTKLKEDPSLFNNYLNHWDGVHVFTDK